MFLPRSLALVRQTNPDSGLFLPGSEYRSAKPGDLDMPAMDGRMQPISITASEPMQLGIKPLTYGRVICISTRAKVTKDDRVQSFGALVLGGNGKGVAGYGYGRGKSGQLALIDAEKKLHLNLQTLPLYEDYTIFHQAVGYFKRTCAVIRPACDGRGLHAGKLAHGIMSCFGIKDAYAKLYGQNNVYSQTKAIFKALSNVRSAEEFALARGRKFWELNRSWIDRPARFLDFKVPEKERMKVCGRFSRVLLFCDGGSTNCFFDVFHLFPFSLSERGGGARRARARGAAVAR